MTIENLFDEGIALGAKRLLVSWLANDEICYDGSINEGFYSDDVIDETGEVAWWYNSASISWIYVSSEGTLVIEVEGKGV